MFVGSDLEEVINAIVQGEKAKAQTKRRMNIGVDTLPAIPTDATDRNRTSPFAFTGNKFEFRMPGSSFSITDPNTVINTIVAESLSQFADRLEAATDFSAELSQLIKETFEKHGRIIFNGNNYSDEWKQEAKQRGLLCLPTTADAIPCLTADKNVKLFEKHAVFTKRELTARKDILLEGYCKTVTVEALTMVEMSNKEIAPAVEKYLQTLTQIARNKVKLVLPASYEQNKINKITQLLVDLAKYTERLENLTSKTQSGDHTEHALFVKDQVIPTMKALRATADKLESICPETDWPFPTYGKLLYSVN
jgi:glutamine synthetase